MTQCWIIFVLALASAVTLVKAADSNGLGGVSLQAIVSHGGCPRDQLHRCVKSAEPLLRNPNYVFPSSNDEVLTVCRLWNEFVQCVRDYSQTCLATGDRLRQQQLQGALDEAVRSVDAMCTDPTYQQDYLRHAPCIKSMATEESKCRNQLGYLVDQVSAFSISNIQICCAHHAFRECMLSATYRYCRTPLDGSAVQFSRDMFSKSLAFLLKQCEDYVPNTSDCPAAAATGMTPPAPGLVSSAGRFDDNPGRFETNGPQDDPPRLPFAGNNDLLTTTRRSNNFVWNSVIQQTTYRPWYAGSSNNNNGVDSPKQQGLFSSACRTPGNRLILIIPVLFLPVLVW